MTRLTAAALVAALVALAAVGCGDTYISVPVTAPSALPPPSPIGALTQVEFRVVGNASSVRVKYATPFDGLAEVVTTLPYSATFQTASTSLFLSLNVAPLAWPVVTAPFLSAQIVVGGALFREATATDFLLNPIDVSGTWRK